MALIGDAKLHDIQCVANGAITKFTVVTLSTDSSDGDPRVATCGTSDKPFGIAQETVATGESILVRLAGISKVSANGAYSLGDALCVAAADGQVDTAAPAGGANAYVIGIALHAATAAGDECPALLRFYEMQGA
jgi:fructoselysine-6-P-deglycase FrlB-like protein